MCFGMLTYIITSIIMTIVLLVPTSLPHLILIIIAAIVAVVAMLVATVGILLFYVNVLQVTVTRSLLDDWLSACGTFLGIF